MYQLLPPLRELHRMRQNAYEMDRLGESEAGDRGDTPLHLACARNEASRVAHLVKGAVPSASVYARNVRGKPPLHLAAEAGHVAAIRALLDHCGRADEVVNALDLAGCSALSAAVINGHKDAVILLSSYGALRQFRTFSLPPPAEPESRDVGGEDGPCQALNVTNRRVYCPGECKA